MVYFHCPPLEEEDDTDDVVDVDGLRDDDNDDMITKQSTTSYCSKKK